MNTFVRRLRKRVGRCTSFMIKIIILGGGIFSWLVGSGQDSIRVEREYWKDIPITKADSAFNSIPDVLFIDLDEGFNDSVVVTVNDERIFSGYIKVFTFDI